MATKLIVYRGAMRILKQATSATFAVTDDEFFRYELDAEYSRAIAFMLEAGKWNFAARTREIDASVDVEPDFGHTHAFERPDDYAGRIIKISPNEMLYPVFGANEYVAEGEYWYASIDPIYVSYVSNGSSYGGDLSLWPESFTTAFEHELAYRVAGTVTSISANEKADLGRLKKKTLTNARSLDASNQPSDLPQPGRLVTARGRGGRNWREGGRWRP